VKSNSKKLRVAVLGASGYTGAELIRLLSCHQKVDLTLLTSERYAGKDIGQVFPQLGRLGLPTLCKIEEVNWEKTDIDVVFCALPHGTTQDVVSGLLVPEEKWSENGCHYLRYKNNNFIWGEGIKIIDLSADFRLANFDVYEKWYGQPHRAQRLQHVALYGLTELCRDKLLISNLIACPGCYPTTSLLPAYTINRCENNYVG
jgi:Acetylglutamate semialdehyde dehydrogenase